MKFASVIALLGFASASATNILICTEAEVSVIMAKASVVGENDITKITGGAMAVAGVCGAVNGDFSSASASCSATCTTSYDAYVIESDPLLVSIDEVADCDLNSAMGGGTAGDPGTCKSMEPCSAKWQFGGLATEVDSGARYYNAHAREGYAMLCGEDEDGGAVAQNALGAAAVASVIMAVAALL